MPNKGYIFKPRSNRKEVYFHNCVKCNAKEPMRCRYPKSEGCTKSKKAIGMNKNDNF